MKNFKVTLEQRRGTSCFPSSYLWVDVQDADLSRLDHLMYGVDLGAVQVPVVLAVLQEAAVFDVALHLAAGHEGVHLAVPLVHLWFSGGD